MRKNNQNNNDKSGNQNDDMIQNTTNDLYKLIQYSTLFRLKNRRINVYCQHSQEECCDHCCEDECVKCSDPPNRRIQSSYDGIPGPQGTAGPAGRVGPQGPAGPEGPSGPPGTAGPAGSCWSCWAHWPAGPPGPTGLTGRVGPPGQVGPAGPAGPAGSDGLAGQVGPQGPPGPGGPTGPQGPGGPAGPAGPEGPQGLPGPAGPAGPQGQAGPAGPQGAQGQAGPAGPQGPAGTGITGFVYLFDTSEQVQIPQNGEVTFNTNGHINPIGFVLHTERTGPIMITQSGTYLIQWEVNVDQGSSAFALFRGIVQIPGSNYGSILGHHSYKGQVISALTTGDILTLRNISSPITLRNTIAATGPAVISASILLEKLA